MTNKYKILENDSIEYFGATLYRIIALKNFGVIKKGDLGGYISKNYNLSKTDNEWIFEGTKIYVRDYNKKPDEIIEHKKPNKQNLYCKKYREKNRTLINNKKNEYYEKNKEEICRKRKESYNKNYEKNKDKINRKRRIWREKNKDEVNKKKRERYIKLKLSKQKTGD